MAIAVKSPVTEYALDVLEGRILTGKLVKFACQRHLDDLKRTDIRFDERLAQRGIDFFANLLLPDGNNAGQSFRLEPWEAFIVGSLVGWVRLDGRRRYQYAYVEVARANGKALALDTPIATPSGWSTMGQLRVGDVVFDERGQPANVIYVAPVQQGNPCYRVTFDDGSTIVADAEHLWYTEMRWSGRTAHGPAKGEPHGAWRKGLRTTAEIASTLMVADARGHRWANHSIPMAPQLDLPDAILPVEPYTLGVWLGDGDSDCARITVADADAEILDHLGVLAVAVGERRTWGGRTPRYRIGGTTNLKGLNGSGSLNARLRAAGLLQHKHIPEMYQRASFDQRLSLLQGLMDTDGYINPRNGQCEFTSTNERLANDTWELSRTLGLKARIHSGRATLNGRDIGPKWRVTFYPPQDVPVFKLARKRAQQRFRGTTRRRSNTDWRIIKVESVPSVPVRCIAVDSPSHLYLAGRSMVATHNTPLGAGMLLYGLAADGERGAQCYSAATTRDQAKIAFRDATKMVEATAELNQRVDKLVNNLTYKPLGAFLRPLSSDASKMDGLRVHIALADELHEHPNGEVIHKLRTGMKSSQPMLIEITTAGYDRETICWEEHDYTAKVVEGVIPDDARFGYIATIDPEDEWTDERVWPKANPNLNITIPIHTLRQECEQAKQIPGHQNAFKRLRLNIWTEQSTRWISSEMWDSPPAIQPIDIDSLAGRPCYAGLDLSTKNDLSALDLIFPPFEEGEPWKVLSWFWLPSEDLRERMNRDRVPYDRWEEAGFIELTEGNSVDYKYIKRTIIELNERYRIIELGYDPWNATELAVDLNQEGVNCVEIHQGYGKLHEPCKRLENLLLDKKLQHGGNPIMRWMAANVSVVYDVAGNMRPDKGEANKHRTRIDGIVALVIALACAVRHEGDGTSIYDARDLLVL